MWLIHIPALLCSWLSPDISAKASPQQSSLWVIFSFCSIVFPQVLNWILDPSPGMLPFIGRCLIIAFMGRWRLVSPTLTSCWCHSSPLSSKGSSSLSVFSIWAEFSTPQINSSCPEDYFLWIQKSGLIVFFQHFKNTVPLLSGLCDFMVIWMTFLLKVNNYSLADFTMFSLSSVFSSLWCVQVWIYLG